MQKLSTRISITIIGVLVLALASSGAALLTAWQVGELMEGAAEQSLPNMRAAEGLELALLEQQGWVLSYTLEPGKQDWLAQLEAHKPPFERWLSRVENSTRTADEHDILARLRKAYNEYDKERNEVVRLFGAGNYGYSSGGSSSSNRRLIMGATPYGPSYWRADRKISGY
jgi:hypothetical protein